MAETQKIALDSPLTLGELWDFIKASSDLGIGPETPVYAKLMRWNGTHALSEVKVTDDDL